MQISLTLRLIYIGALAIIGTMVCPRTASADSGCELHVWGTMSGVMPDPQGQDAGNSTPLVRRVLPNDDPLSPASMIDIRQRLFDLREEDVRAALSVPIETKIIIETGNILPLETTLGPAMPVRLNSSPCYSDLILRAISIVPGKVVFKSQSFLSFKFYYRSYTKDGAPVLRIDGSLHPVLDDPSKKISRDDAIKELREMMPWMLNRIGASVRKKRH